MASKEITNLSTPSEVSTARRELDQSQRLYNEWFTSITDDPRIVKSGQIATPDQTEILKKDYSIGLLPSLTQPGQSLSYDDAESINYQQGYGVITPVDQQQRKIEIASQFDYIAVGDPYSNTTTVGGVEFYVPGLNANTNYSTAPGTSLTTDDAASIYGQSTPAFPQEPTFNGNNPYAPKSVTQDFPNANSSTRFTDAAIPNGIATTGFDSNQRGNVQGIAIVDDGRGNNENAVTSAVAGTDDSGDVSGTGINSGVVEWGEFTEDGSVVGSGSLDNDRTDRPPSTGAASGNVDAGTGLPSGAAGTFTPNGAGTVDVSRFAQSRESSGSGSSVEENNPGVQLRQNVLHNYANWTYGLGLYMLTPNTHASIVTNGGITDPTSELSNLLIRSGGTGGRGALGESKDYYLENLRFTSVIGQNSQTSSSSNNFDINFEIIEPYGVAFMAELVQLALAKGIADHFEIPYLLEIKFKGFDDKGNVIPEIPNSGPKYIPIKIVNITFKITSAATIYTVSAVPYAHSPLQNQHDAIIQESISIQGSTFRDLMASLFEYLQNAENSKAKLQNRVPDTYQFIVHDNDLANSKVGFEHVKDGNVISIDKQAYGDAGDLREVIQISSGSTLKSSIQAIAAATDFGAKFNTVGQPESEQGNDKKPLRLLKVIPVVSRLGEYNTSTKRYAKEVVYRIDTQSMYGFVLPDMPGGHPSLRGWVKEYNWLFTGKNQDILDFNAEYNVQYFNIRNVYTEFKGNVVGTPSIIGNALLDTGTTRTGAGGATYSPAIVAVNSPVTNSVQNSFRGAAHQLASDHMDNILNNPGADMLAIDLAIIGDPDWIPQDRSILPSGVTPSGDARIINGSIATDTHDVFIMLKFRTPRDYDPEKGLMQIDTDHTFVQGLYRAITVESNFYDGKFEQRLKLVRVQNQNSNDSANLPNLSGYNTNYSDKELDSLFQLPTSANRYGTFNADGTIAGPGQLARPGKPSSQVVVQGPIDSNMIDIDVTPETLLGPQAPPRPVIVTGPQAPPRPDGSIDPGQVTLNPGVNVRDTEQFNQ